jgi:uncharacterized protein (DUF488 family)
MSQEIRPGAGLFSIGHSNQSIETFLQLLQQHQLQVLIDVRSSPYSRYVPHFNSASLSSAVHEVGIKYVFLGKTLGGRPDGDEFYDEESHVLYDRLAVAPFFLEGITRLQNIARRYKAAIVCSEEDPTTCHRYLLIGRVLSQQGCELTHIRGDGRLETNAELASHAETPAYTQSLWGEKVELEGEKPWRSIRPVSPKKPLPSSLGH